MVKTSVKFREFYSCTDIRKDGKPKTTCMSIHFFFEKAEDENWASVGIFGIEFEGIVLSLEENDKLMGLC